MPQRKIRARAPRPGVSNLKTAKAAVPVAAFLCAVALFAQSAFRIAAGESIEAELSQVQAQMAKYLEELGL